MDGNTALDNEKSPNLLINIDLFAFQISLSRPKDNERDRSAISASSGLV
jgi:hypothetical protein